MIVSLLLSYCNNRYLCARILFQGEYVNLSSRFFAHVAYRKKGLPIYFNKTPIIMEGFWVQLFANISNQIFHVHLCYFYVSVY